MKKLVPVVLMLYPLFGVLPAQTASDTIMMKQRESWVALMYGHESRTQEFAVVHITVLTRKLA